MSKPNVPSGQWCEDVPAIGEMMTEGLFVVSRQGAVVYVNQAAAEMLGVNRQALLRPIDDYSNLGLDWLSDGRPIPPSDFPLRRLWRGQDFSNVELRLRSQNASRRLVWSGRQTRDATGDVQGLAVVRDVTSEHRRRDYWRMASVVASELSETSDLSTAIELLQDQILETLGSDTIISIWRADESKKELGLLAQRNLSPRTEQMMKQLPFNAPLVAARTATTKQTQIVQDTRNLPRSLGMAYQVVESARLRSYVSLPLKAAGSLQGVLNIGLHSPKAFTADDIAVLQVVADLLGTAMLVDKTISESEREHDGLLALARQSEEAVIRLRSALDKARLQRYSHQPQDRNC